MTDHSHVNGVLRCCCNGNRLVYELNQSIMGIKAHKREKELLVFKDNSSLIWPKAPFLFRTFIDMGSFAPDFFFNLWHPSYIEWSKSLVVLRCPL